ncbi:MAG TPA: serine protease [Kofleriaceae bacterium]
MRSTLFALLGSGCAVSGVTSSTDQPIIGGETTSTTTYKTVVDLEEDPGNWFCTGTLIDKDWVLTAAHCVTGEVEETADKVHVRFDADNINTGSTGMLVAVSEIHFNPGYNGNDWDNDIALVKLATSVTDRTPTPVHRGTVAFDTMVTTVGYGDSNNNGGGAGVLRKLDEPTVDCGMANDAGISNANLLCFSGSDGNASCYGDSGGPAFVNGEVAGITSGGTEDKCTAGWDLYTSVSAEIAFVDQYVTANANTGSGSGSDVTGPGSDTGSDAGSDPTDNHDGSKDGGGCNTSGTGSSGALLAIAGVLVARRRRSMLRA